MGPVPADPSPASRGSGGFSFTDGITALLGPTNTGKTHRAIERMLEHRTGMIGLPLRLLAREVYERVSTQVGEDAVALVTGEEKRVPARPRFWVCTVESMPLDLTVDFIAVDEIQLAAHRQRGHTFTHRLMHVRGLRETWLMGADTMRPMLTQLLPTARVQQHPRLSQLTYTGAHALASLPPRTAVVAFSADDVYALAERLRQRHGGTAVVLGALSPRTRNAQVAMYQSGEVQHMVATDAIGMGLNMDVDRVVFASLRKFDGREARALDVTEMAQIAGRAGRYTTDGGFGVLRPLEGLPPRVVSAIESHRFVDVQRLVWRNADLDFSTIEALIESLRQRPTRRILRIIERADDFEALQRMAQLPSVRALADSPERVALLWDVCRIPDFRKLLLDSHVELVAAVFGQLAGPHGRIDSEWMAGRVARLDDAVGDIQTLMQRIAFIRTFTYVCNQSRWIEDAKQWQARTAAIEDRLSDALHERLTERFVDGAAPTFVGPALGRRPVKAPRKPIDRRPRVEDGPFAALAELESALAPSPGEVGARGDDGRAAWVQRLVDAPFEAFALQDDARVRFGDEVVGRLRAGVDLEHPEVVVTADGLGAGARARVLRRLQAYAADVVAKIAGPLPTLPDDLPPAARGLAYQLQRGLGVVLRRRAQAQAGGMAAEGRTALEAIGVVFGRHVIYLPDGQGARSVAWRAALYNAFVRPPIAGQAPAEGAVSVEPAAELDPEFYLRIGYPIVAGRAVRADQLERAAARLATLGPGPWAIPAELGAWLGVRRHRVESIVRSLGYRKGPEGWGRGGAGPKANARGKRGRAGRNAKRRDKSGPKSTAKRGTGRTRRGGQQTE